MIKRNFEMKPEEIEDIKEELKDFYGTAMTNGFPMAVVDLGNLDSLDEDDLKELAKSIGITK